MTAIVLCSAAAMWFVRLLTVLRVWSLPLKHGQDYFLGQRVGPDFYRRAGAGLLRRFRASLFVPLGLDLPVVLWLLLTRKYLFLSLEQLFAYIAGLVVYNVMLTHFACRALPISGYENDAPVKAVQLSMEPRRLRDHTSLAVELVTACALLLDAALLSHSYQLAHSPAYNPDAASDFRGAAVFAVWILYWQVGALLLKRVFIRWRMPLPLNRTEDFRRWRTAWLRWHLRLLDAVRVMTAVLLPWITAWVVYRKTWSKPAIITLVSGTLLILAVYLIYLRREHRRLLIVEKELRPVEMAREFPRMPVADGRFLAGGFIYLNRENPRLLVRSHQGIAINLSNPSIYAWTAYFIGLLALITWMAGMSR